MEELLQYFNPIEIDIIKNTMNLYDKAYYIVYRLFHNVKDKSGKPYIQHLLTVSNQVGGKNEKVVALLHDTIEDTNFTDQSLLLLGFPLTVVEAVLLVTRKENESYEEFITRIIRSQNKIALKVQKADLENRLALTRISECPIEEQKSKEIKYKK